MAASDKHSVLPATEREAALRRIGLYETDGRKAVHRGNQRRLLEWFLNVAQRKQPFKTLPEVEVELLRHEYRAIQETALRFYENVVTVDGLEKFRIQVRAHLEELADKGFTDFGPFTLTRKILRYSAAGEMKNASAALVEPEGGNGLLHLLSELLAREELTVLRCPECEKMFVRPRSDARFCSRPCQAKAHSKSQREQAKKKGSEQVRNPSKLVIKARAAVPRKLNKQNTARKSKSKL